MTKRVLLSFLVFSAACVLPLLFASGPAAAQTVPAGFEDRKVTDLQNATAFAFTPDRRMLIATKPGQLRVFKNGQLLATPALDITGRVCSNSERGMLGVAVDPDFGTPGNDFVYLYYTDRNNAGQCDNSSTPVNRVSRFEMTGDTLNPASEDVLVDGIFSSVRGNHNAGDLHFGKDGNLYISVGDAGCDYKNQNRCQNENTAARDLNVLNGKILRITRTGGIPTGNPYPNGNRCNATGRTVAGANCQEIFATGLRNPFRMAFDPDATGTSFRINDVGGGFWEEIDTGIGGADYGWNRREGPCALASYTNCGPPPAGLTNPIHAYPHTTGCESITGGAFVPNGSFPAGYDNAYLFGDYVCNKIFRLEPRAGGGFTRTVFANNLGPGGPVHMAFGPYGGGRALYYTTFDGGGQVRRIAFTNGNRLPVAAVQADPPYAEAPGDLTIDFSGANSTDPDGARDLPLTYEWDFTSDGTVDATTQNPSHTYAATGRYTATLRVTDARGAVSDPDTIEVFPGDQPPDPTIQSPAAGSLFSVGQSLTLDGSATDPEDGQLGGTSFSWDVRRHHDGNHAHPYFSGDGDGLTFRAPPPEDLSATSPVGNYLEVRFTATDSLGLSVTETRILRPKTVSVRFQSRPTVGFKLKLNGRTIEAPRTILSWENYRLNVSAPSQRLNGRAWVFRSWSDGKPATHTIVTPSTARTYTATFRPR